MLVGVLALSGWRATLREPYGAGLWIGKESMSYARLHEHFRRVGQLDEIRAIVEWDQAVNMPDSAGDSRAESMATLSRLRHQLLIEPRVSDLLEAAAAQTDLDSWQQANLREMRRQVRRAVAVPADLVEAAEHAEKKSEQAWRLFRKENDFASYMPYLERVIQLTREAAAAVGQTLELESYDALLDGFEPGMRRDLVERALSPLERFLPDFTDRVIERQKAVRAIVPPGPFDVDRQRRLGLRLLRDVGFDAARGRLDISHHPFCGGVPTDVRITTRYDENDFTSGLMGILHEAGHGKYEQGLPRRWLHQPVGLARGIALHESQSLLLEMQVCRGRAFLTYAAPLIREAFAESASAEPGAYSPENLEALALRVERGLIRVDADEVTYPAHILLRYEIERDLIEADIEVRDLPEVWDAGMQKLLRLRTAGNDRDGCLQDVHWPSGGFGYFPLYTIGAMIAAQLFSKLASDASDLAMQIEKGRFQQLDAWLSRFVWQLGSFCTTDEILQRATGESLNPEFFIDHLRRRYLPD